VLSESFLINEVPVYVRWWSGKVRGAEQKMVVHERTADDGWVKVPGHPYCDKGTALGGPLSVQDDDEEEEEEEEEEDEDEDADLDI